jgi:uncharacterized protein YukE
MNRQLSGMDISQIRAMAKNMDRKADELRRLVDSLTGQVHAASWAGNDRNRFVDEWGHRHAAALRRVADDLDTSARQARDHANAQERASKAR